MSRLIDAEKIDFNEVFGGQSDFAKDTRGAAQSLIDAQPTVEAVPVVHGEWIREEKAGVDYWCCLHCHKIRSEYYAKPKDNFCHNCGTYMRKKENKENDES